MRTLEKDIVLVRGGGDLATGVIQKLFRAGIRVGILETQEPTAIRRSVALCEAVYEGKAQVEDMVACKVDAYASCYPIWEKGQIPLLVDPECQSLSVLQPDGLVDAILAKRNLGLRAEMASVVIALGPGFRVPLDADAVIETMRGHDLGRVLLDGCAQANTGIPGVIDGKGEQRVLRAPCSGTVRHHKKIGDYVEEGAPVFSVSDEMVRAPFCGLLRGLIREGLNVVQGMKTADIDPRRDSDWRGISDKARCIGGGVLEAYLYLQRKRL